MSITPDDLLSGGTPAYNEAILRFFDDEAKMAAFDHYMTNLERTSDGTLDLGALRICSRLLPSKFSDERTSSLYVRLEESILHHLLLLTHDDERLYLLAEATVSNVQLGHEVFSRLTDYVIESARDEVFHLEAEEMVYSGECVPRDERVRKVLAYIRFLTCSYWLPSNCSHYITLELVTFLASSVGKSILDDAVHDTLSALLSLLSKPPVAALCGHGSVAPLFVQPDIIGQSLFARLDELPLHHFSSNAGKVFRTWFQWIAHANANHLEIEAVYTAPYWERIRMGLLTGFSDQRKYCLGILHLSLALARRNIDTPQMGLDIEQRSVYQQQYQKFSVLFETIVLDRYPNQVQACLPELTALFRTNSVITPTWTTTLLTAALNPKIQDGVRKLVGNWYLTYVREDQANLASHTNFIVEGFLPWATQGHLFTSTLISDRTVTRCLHGDALSEAITAFVTAGQTDFERRHLLAETLSFILDRGGRLFVPSISYLLEGLLKGFFVRSATLGAAEFDLILQVSRLPGLPEIATDLCTAYCVQLSHFAEAQTWDDDVLPRRDALLARFTALAEHQKPRIYAATEHGSSPTVVRNVKSFLSKLNFSQHKIIQNDSFAPACREVINMLDASEAGAIHLDELLAVLDAFWEEADRQEYPRAVVVNLPPLFFHPNCVRACVQEYSTQSPGIVGHFTTMLTTALMQLQRFTEGRSYLLATLAISVRRACFLFPRIMSILPLEEFLIRFINDPPSPKPEFLFEIAAAGKLQQYVPHRDYTFYYGQREWYGYAAVIDLLNRFPDDQADVAKQVFDRLVGPWSTQKAPIPIISKWKDVLQLQTMLLMTQACVDGSNVDLYLDAFMHALILEQWPRYRFLLEWIIARIYYRFPDRTDRILADLASLDENSPVHVASLIKLATLVVPLLDSEHFALTFITRLVPLSASPKVHVRHEAHWSFPSIFELAERRNWSNITSNPALQALNSHIRSLDKFTAPPPTIRVFKLDAANDYSISHIFLGHYLWLETPERERVAHGDFLALYAEDRTSRYHVQVPSARIPLGESNEMGLSARPTTIEASQMSDSLQLIDSGSPFFQTKSGFDVASLLPLPGHPTAQSKRPCSVVLIASLIDNPTNLGGLSRISESFGLEALYINDLKKIGHKDFKATSVSSAQHLPIFELKIPAVPEFLLLLKRRGYGVVGIEQTDKSGILGEEGCQKGVGTLPRRCVLVLGSEKGGITSEVLTVVDRCVEIRTVGVTRSLNVQTAGGIAVYEWWREWGGQM